jgi:penicillin-binding protein A
MPLNKKKKKKSLVPFRLNVLFFLVFLLFSVLVLRLGELQIVFGEDFKREIERTEDITVSNPVPRGKMFDRNGNIIVDNSPLNAITYTKSQETSREEMLETAEKLAKIIEMETAKIPVRDKKDYWILKHPKQAEEKITEKEWAKYEQKELSDKDLYKLQLKRVTDEEIDSIQGQELETLAVYTKFNSGYALTPQIVKNKDVTPEEFAAVSENLESLPGVDTTTDWDRLYVNGNTLKSILGDVSSSESGLPKEQLEKYLAKDYSRNDRVGKSYLELKYEDVLHGEKAKVKNITDKSGKVLSTEVISEGKRGKDLVLTIDMDLQSQVEKIIEEEMWAAKQKYASTALMDRAFVVVMDPRTGEILSLAGRQIGKEKETGKPVMMDYAQGTFTSSYNVGSSIKGATVLTGYQTGAIKPGTVLLDEPLRIASTKEKSSWKTFGSINDLRALQVSSNVYMFKTAISMAGGHYVPNKPLPIDYSAFNTMRKYFSQFGLGVRTGIDLPNEMTGFPGTEKTPGLLLDLSIGQYDTYTPVQLAQYVSTIANGGYRIQPHIVKEIREPLMENNELGPIVEEIQPKVLNRIDMKEEWVKRVQEGFRMVMQVGDGTGVGHWKSAAYNPAGKTGTAQAFYDGSDKSKRMTPVMNLSLVTFAPYDNPEVAMAVVVPWAYEGHSGPSINHLIGRRVMDAYFNLKSSRQDPDAIENVENAAEVPEGNNNQ